MTPIPYTPEQLAAAGYAPIPDQPEMPSIPSLARTQRLSRDYAEISSFRMANGLWRMFYKPGVKPKTMGALLG